MELHSTVDCHVKCVPQALSEVLTDSHEESWSTHWNLGIIRKVQAKYWDIIENGLLPCKVVPIFIN